MKKIENFVRENRVWMSLVLFMLAVVTGGSAMATGAVIGDEGPDATASNAETDPANPEVNDMMAPGDGAAGQDLTGTQASSTQLRKGGLIEDEWDSELTRFMPYRTPLLSIARQVSRKVNVSNWTIKHGRVGGETLDGRTTAKIAGGATIELNSSNFSGSLKPFYKGSTIFVPTVNGYKKGSATEVEGGLMLFVTDNDGKRVTCMAVNGKLKADTVATDDLDCMECPEIPANTYICAGATAASESQLLITPENYQPREEEFNVQKKLLNIVFTEDYLKVKKKQPIKVADLKTDAIAKYNMRAERTYWLGTQSRFSVTHGDGSIEDVYTTKGLLWQVTNSYAVEKGKLTLGDLIAISKLQHTTFSQSDTSYAFCGRNFMEWLLNLDMGSNQRIISMNDVRDLDLDFKQLKTTFGTTNFIYDQGLDLIGMEDACVVLDLKGATRYVKTNEKERTNDMSKGAGEIRDAKRIIHEEADGLALRGYNSIIVAPTDIAFHLPDTQMRSNIVSSAKLLATPANGVIVALTADYEDGGKKYEAGNVYQYNGSEWVEFTGSTTAV